MHNEIRKAIDRHKEFYEGKRKYLFKFTITGFDISNWYLDNTDVYQVSGCLKPDYEKMKQKLVAEIPYNGMDWDSQFTEYYKRRVHNMMVRAEHRLNMGVGDDYVPVYIPYFGNAIHHVFFGGKITFGGGTSYCAEVIKEAGEYGKLRYDVHNPWMERLAEALRYCRDNGEGIIYAALRGGNGPMDMANGIMGNNIFMEFMDDEENMHKVMDICTRSCEVMYELQKENASHISGGYFAAQGALWMPDPMFGQISIDAAHLSGPGLYKEFEKPYIEQLSEKYEGFLLHTHMMGWKIHDIFAGTKGIKIIRPVDDPKHPTVIEKLEHLLDAIGDTALMLSVKKDEIDTVMPHFKDRQAIFELEAADKEDAMRQMEQISKILGI